MNRSTLSLASLTTVVVALVAASCSGGSDSPSLSEAGERGKRISINQGCAACHGVDGQGNSGPKWQGLAGSEVVLRDGTTIVADDEYLVRSITDPGADLLDGFVLQMPRNTLSDSEVADVIAYIKDLSPAQE